MKIQNSILFGKFAIIACYSTFLKFQPQTSGDRLSQYILLQDNVVPVFEFWFLEDSFEILSNYFFDWKDYSLNKKEFGMFTDDSDEFNFILKMSITNITSRICHALKRKSQEIYARLHFHSWIFHEWTFISRSTFTICTYVNVVKAWVYRKNREWLIKMREQVDILTKPSDNWQVIMVCLNDIHRW